MFYGIIVGMYFAPKEHPPPHFHAYYSGHKAVVDIRTCEIIEGDFPKKHSKLLMADWELVMNGEEPFRIPPLQ
jgi:hypothetical protein